jgi:hypothetical protein
MRARFRELPAILGEEGVLDRVAELILNELPVPRQPCPTAT